MTPAFIGSSDDDRAEWNAKSIRGELRWWFRAIAGGELLGDAQKVRELERSVFGGIDAQSRDDSSSALRVLAQVIRLNTGRETESLPDIRLSEVDLAKDWNNATPAVEQRLQLHRGKTNPLGSLGYGPIVSNRYHRGRIAEGSDLGLTFQWNREPSAEAKLVFDRAFWCWINLGGIGARSRRGYGSLVRLDDSALRDIEEFKSRALEILSGARAALPAGREAEWTHFTSEAHVYRSRNAYKSWSEALRFAGAWMIAFRRRYGTNSDERTAVRGRDYEWFKHGPPFQVPDRAGFGLPLPFGQEAMAGWGVNEGRRASPLLIHISRFGSSSYQIILTHIPARLVPLGEKISFKGTSFAPTPRQKAIVQTFLDDLKNRGNLIVEVV